MTPLMHQNILIKVYKHTMTNVTLEAISELLQTELKPIKDELLVIRQTLDSHTLALDALVKNTSNLQTEFVIMKDRLEKYEKVIKFLGQKLDVDVESMLH